MNDAGGFVPVGPSARGRRPGGALAFRIVLRLVVFVAILLVVLGIVTKF